MLKPIVFDTIIYSDIDIDFTPINNDISINENEQAILGAIQNIFRTNTGERLFNPEFGFNFKRFIGQDITDLTALELEESLYRNLNRFENRIQQANIDVIPQPDKKSYFVTIDFTGSYSDIRRTITFSLDLNR